MDSKLLPWWFPLGDFILVISLWWFWDQLTSLIILWRTPIASPKFLCDSFAFHATCILFLSFLTIISFLTTTSYSTTALGPSLDALDRCLGFLTWRYWVGVRTVRQETVTSFPTMCYYSVYYSHSRLSILKVFWWRREWRVTSVACLTTADPLLVVLPTTCWNPGLWSTKTLLWVVSHLEAALPFFVVRGFIYMRRRLFPEYHIWPILTMEQLPHVFVPSRTPLRTWIPMWSSVGTSYLGKPVIYFRLTVSGCLSPVALTCVCFCFGHVLTGRKHWRNYPQNLGMLTANV